MILGLQLLQSHLDTMKIHLQDLVGNEDVMTECDDLFQELHDNATVAVNTLNDLINYDKVESKTFSIEKNSVKIWSVIRQTVGLLSLQAKEKKVTVSMEIEQPTSNISLSHLRVLGDSIKLSQVIRNLVSNALKFTPSSGMILISGHLTFFFFPLFLNSEISAVLYFSKSAGCNSP